MPQLMNGPAITDDVTKSKLHMLTYFGIVSTAWHTTHATNGNVIVMRATDIRYKREPEAKVSVARHCRSVPYAHILSKLRAQTNS
jgi:hypothetical protein